jgi:hypothetical protein
MYRLATVSELVRTHTRCRGVDVMDRSIHGEIMHHFVPFSRSSISVLRNAAAFDDLKDTAMEDVRIGLFQG